MPNKTWKILDQYNITLDKNKSQNYLIDNNKLNNILKFANIKDTETILEIGAGIGTMTLPMAKRAKHVIAIEKDPIISDILNRRVMAEKLDNVTVLNDDALKIDFPSFDKVVSNLPYQISSPVTFKLLEYNFKKAVLMYQYEFAKRMNAPVNTKDYSRLSVALYYRADIQIVDTLKPESFLPRPKVNSAVIELIPKTCNLPSLFDDVTRALFQHKNKKARKSLTNSAHEFGWDKKKFKETVKGVDNPLFEKKVFTLTPAEIVEISEIIDELE